MKINQENERKYLQIIYFIKDLYLEDMKKSYNSIRIGIDVFPRKIYKCPISWK